MFSKEDEEHLKLIETENKIKFLWINFKLQNATPCLSIHMRWWPPALMMMRDIEKIYKHTNFNLNGTVIIKKEANVDDNIQVGWVEGSFHIFIDLNKRHKISFRLVLCLPVHGRMGYGIKSRTAPSSECIIWVLLLVFGWLHDWGLLTYFYSVFALFADKFCWCFMVTRTFRVFLSIFAWWFGDWDLKCLNLKAENFYSSKNFCRNQLDEPVLRSR